MTREEARDKWYESLDGCWRDIGPDEIWDAAHLAGQIAMRERAARLGENRSDGWCSATPNEIRQLEPE